MFGCDVDKAIWRRCSAFEWAREKTLTADKESNHDYVSQVAAHGTKIVPVVRIEGYEERGPTLENRDYLWGSRNICCSVLELLPPFVFAIMMNSKIETSWSSRSSITRCGNNLGMATYDRPSKCCEMRVANNVTYWSAIVMSLPTCWITREQHLAFYNQEHGWWI